MIRIRADFHTHSIGEEMFRPRAENLVARHITRWWRSLRLRLAGTMSRTPFVPVARHPSEPGEERKHERDEADRTIRPRNELRRHSAGDHRRVQDLRPGYDRGGGHWLIAAVDEEAGRGGARPRRESRGVGLQPGLENRRLTRGADQRHGDWLVRSRAADGYPREWHGAAGAAGGLRA